MVKRRTLLASSSVLLSPNVARPRDAERVITVGTGLAGGVYNAVGAALAGIFTRELPVMAAIPRPSGGSLANIGVLDSGEATVAFAGVDSAVNAADGGGPFRGKPVGLRALALLFSEQMHVVATAETGIHTLADIRGKRVSTGFSGSGTNGMSHRLLMVAGIGRNQAFTRRDGLNLIDSCAGLRAGSLDPFFFCAGVPVGTIRALAESAGPAITLIVHDNLAAGVIGRDAHVYYPEIIPANAYPGLVTDNRQISVADVLLVRDTMPAEQTAALLQVVWSNRAELAHVHPVLANFTLAGQKSTAIGVPWHPAAEAFWTAQGADLT